MRARPSAAAFCSPWSPNGSVPWSNTAAGPSGTSPSPAFDDCVTELPIPPGWHNMGLDGDRLRDGRPNSPGSFRSDAGIRGGSADPFANIWCTDDVRLSVDRDCDCDPSAIPCGPIPESGLRERRSFGVMGRARERLRLARWVCLACESWVRSLLEYLRSCSEGDGSRRRFRKFWERDASRERSRLKEDPRRQESGGDLGRSSRLGDTRLRGLTLP